MPNRPSGREEPDHILIAEDDAAQRLGLQQLVRSWGFSVEAAVDGDDALRKMSSGVRPTIILTDLIMPNRTGLDLLRALRQQNDDDITVVIMTAQGTVESAVEAIKQGAYDYLSKPIDPQRLRILV